MKKDPGVVVTCDRCEIPFDKNQRIPTILPDCAHTLCSECIKELLDNPLIFVKVCPFCKTKIGEDHGAQDFKVNHKLYSLITNPGAVKLTNFIPCDLHEDKPVEYFCKACALAVCVKCIYDHHNGHNLI
jgi:hypothetical protein